MRLDNEGNAIKVFELPITAKGRNTAMIYFPETKKYFGLPYLTTIRVHSIVLTRKLKRVNLYQILMTAFSSQCSVLESNLKLTIFRAQSLR